MALRAYKRYTVKEYREPYIRWAFPTASYPMDSTDRWYGKSSYELTETGEVILSGVDTSVGGHADGYVYYITGDGGSDIEYDRADHSDFYHQYARGYVEFKAPVNKKGEYIDFITAEDGTYPVDGEQGAYWYVIGGTAANPSNLIPNGGELWSGDNAVHWTGPQGSLNYKIYYSHNNGASFALLGTSIQSSYTHNFSSLIESSTALIKVEAYNGNEPTGIVVSEGVFTVRHNLPPNAPTNLKPNGEAIDRTKTTVMSWKRNDPNGPSDPQSKAEIEWRTQGSSLWTLWETVSMEEEYVISPNTFPLGQNEWRVRTYDQMNAVGPYSNIAVFTSANTTPKPVILEPLATAYVSRPVIKWSGIGQISYQIIIENSLDEVIWNTGEVAGSVKARTAGVDFENGATYKVKVRIKSGSGLFSAYTESIVIADYTPPAKPTLNAYQADGYIAFGIDSPTPIEPQPIVSSYEIYKRIGGVWTRITYGSGTSFSDYHVKSGQTYEYYVKALGVNGTSSISAVVAKSATFSGSWIHTVQDAGATLRHFRYNGTGYDASLEPDSSVMKFAGRKRPVVHFGDYEEYALTVKIQEIEGMGDMDALRRFVTDRETICYRDTDGNLVVGHLLSFRESKEYRVSSAIITIIEADYSEGV